MSAQAWTEIQKEAFALSVSAALPCVKVVDAEPETGDVDEPRAKSVRQGS